MATRIQREPKGARKGPREGPGGGFGGLLDSEEQIMGSGRPRGLRIEFSSKKTSLGFGGALNFEDVYGAFGHLWSAVGFSVRS